MDRMDRIVLSIRSIRSTGEGEKCEIDCVDGPNGSNHGYSIHPGNGETIKEPCGRTESLYEIAAGSAATYPATWRSGGEGGYAKL